MHLKYVHGLKCKECSRNYPVIPQHVCEFCFGPLEVDYDLEGIGANIDRRTIADGPVSLWRYADFLPAPEGRIDLGAGFSRLTPAPRLAAELGLKKLWLKNDGSNPTHSFKDRVVTVALSVARSFGYRVAACASTGNLAGAVAAHAAASGMQSVVMIPSGLESGKIAAAAIYGAQAEGCSPVATAFESGSDEVRPVKPNTIARSLAIGDPADGYYAIEEARVSGGRIASIPESSVVDGIRLLAETEGIFTETVGGVTIATLERLVREGSISAEEESVALITGTGLKTLEALGRPSVTHRIQPSLESFERSLGKEVPA
ncbi:MAG: threonine synthase [Actinomycetota bacterium]